MLLVRKMNGSSLPFACKEEEVGKLAYRNSVVKIEMIKMPDDLPELSELLEDDTYLPNPEAIEEEIMQDYTGEMTYAGSPMICRGVMDCDPPEPPEFDLPSADDFKEAYRIAYANALLENVRPYIKSRYFSDKEYSIDSMKISDNDRQLILEIADDSIIYPDDDDIFYRYGRED